VNLDLDHQARAGAMPAFAFAAENAAAATHAPAAHAFAALGVVINHAAGEEVFGQGEPAQYVYQVLRGTVRTYRILGDGRRQVCEFHLPGDFVGMDADGAYRGSAEGMTDVTLVTIRRSVLTQRAASDLALTQMLWDLSVRSLQQSQAHASILGRLSAVERVAAFLDNFADRVQARGTIDLPMTRQDIADYLGLTIHTVSRTLSLLQSQGLIDARASRHVQLRRRQALADMCA
jgi:CRP-like cAMP-binding protein